MHATTSEPTSTIGALFFVTGTRRGQEVFLGRVIAESMPGRLTLEGKMLSLAANGRLVVRPFTTAMNISADERVPGVECITDPAARTEAARLLELAGSHVDRSTAPHAFACLESALRLAERSDSLRRGAAEDATPDDSDGFEANPLLGSWRAFAATAEEFRQVLTCCRRVESTRELDRIVELEADLFIEVGKITNRTGAQLNALARNRPTLARFAAEAQASPVTDPLDPTIAWTCVAERVQLAKARARQAGDAELVTELEALAAERFDALHDVVVDHVDALDTLIDDAFAEYGIEYEFASESGARDTRRRRA